MIEVLLAIVGVLLAQCIRWTQEPPVTDTKRNVFAGIIIASLGVIVWIMKVTPVRL